MRVTRSLCVNVQFFFEPLELYVSLADHSVESLNERLLLRFCFLLSLVRENGMRVIHELLFPEANLYRMRFVLAAKLTVRFEALDGIDGDDCF